MKPTIPTGAKIVHSTPTNALVTQGFVITNYHVYARANVLPECEAVANFNVVCDCSDLPYLDPLPTREIRMKPDTCGDTSAILWDYIDLCGNIVEVWCTGQYEVYYDNGQSVTLVACCYYGGGDNEGYVYVTLDGCRILRTQWTNLDDSKIGIRPWDEGTLGVYDWTVYKYDCVRESGTTNCLEGEVQGYEFDPSTTDSDCEVCNGIFQ